MGGASECFFHAGRPAVTRCKQCGKPLCSDCRLVTEDGLFCSDKCAQTASVFVKRSQALEDKKAVRRKGIPAGLVRFIIFLIIILVVYKLGKQLVAQGFFEKVLQTIKKPG